MKFDIKYERNKVIEKLMLWMVWRLPKVLVYFCAIRVGAFATTGKYSDTVVPDLKFMDVLKRWDINPPTDDSD